MPHLKPIKNLKIIKKIPKIKMETQNAIKLVKELKNNRMFPQYNVNLATAVQDEINM